MFNTVLGNLLIRLTGDATQFEKMIAGTEALFDRASRRLLGAGNLMTRALTVPLTALGVLSVKTSSDFDQAMTHSLVRFGGMSEGMRSKFESTARSIAKHSTSSAVELANAFGYMADAGMKPKNAITDLDYIQKFATRNSLTLERAIAILTDSMSELGLETNNPKENLKNMIQLGDQMTRTTELAGVSIEELGKSLEKHGGSAMRRFNISTEEGLSLLATFAAQGAKAGQGGQYLADHLAHRRLGTRRGLAEDASAILQRNAAFTQRIQRELQSTSTKGLVDREATAMLKNFNDQMSILWHNIQDAGIEIGRVLIPALEWLNKKLMEVLKWWEGLSKTTKEWVVWVGFGIGVLGPFLILLGSIFGLVTWINWTFMFWIGLITITAGALLGLIDVFLQMTAGINLGFADLIGSFRIGGYQISTWLASAFFAGAIAWEKASTLVMGGLMTLWKGFKDFGGAVSRFLLEVLKVVVVGFLNGLSTLAVALDFWIAQLNKVLAPLGISFAGGFAAGLKTATADAMKFFDNEVKNSLLEATQRHAEFYRDINKMGKDSAKAQAAYFNDLVGVFADDRQDKRAADRKAAAKGGIGAAVAGTDVNSTSDEPDDFDPGNKSMRPAKHQSFGTISLRRFNLDGVGGVSRLAPKQQVEAKGVEHRLDKIHDKLRDSSCCLKLR